MATYICNKDLLCRSCGQHKVFTKDKNYEGYPHPRKEGLVLMEDDNGEPQPVTSFPLKKGDDPWLKYFTPLDEIITTEELKDSITKIRELELV